MEFHCRHGANKWIAEHFHDCVYNWRDLAGFCFGLAAILLWVVAQLPQFVSNYRRKSADALSPWFLAEWLLGDTCNLLGCLLQGEQLPTTTYTAMYFVMSDVLMMFQYIYYGSLQKRKERILKLQSSRRNRQRHRHSHAHHHGSEPGAEYGHSMGGASRGSTSTRGDTEGGAFHKHHTDVEAAHDSCHETMEHSSQQQQRGLEQHGQRRSQQQLAGSTDDAPAGQQSSSNTTSPHQQQQQQQQQQQFITAGLPGIRPNGRFAVGALISLGAVSVLVPVASLLRGGAPAGSPAFSSSALPPPAAAAAAQAGLPEEGPGADWMFVAGTALGYCSAVLYLCSRVSQIYKNWKRQSAEGLAITMFMTAACANFCTGTGIVLRTFNMEQLKQQAPWLIGSMGTITLDMVILAQSFRYNAAAKQVHEHQQRAEQRLTAGDDEDGPLLHLEQPLLHQVPSPR